MLLMTPSLPPSLLPPQNYTTIVSPVIDILSKDTMQYTLASSTVKGGFGPNLHFKWITMSSLELRTRTSAIQPIRCVEDTQT